MYIMAAKTSGSVLLLGTGTVGTVMPETRWSDRWVYSRSKNATFSRSPHAKL